MAFWIFAFVVANLLPPSQASYIPLATAELETRSSGIQWGPCADEFEASKQYNTPIDCGNLTVPLDYGDQSKGTIELNLLRAHAPKGPSRGSVLINYGGPGDAGRLDLVEGLPWSLTLTGFVYDLVIFDPRGTENTIPMFCYNSTESAGNKQNNANASDTAKGEIWVEGENLSNACLLREGTIGPYMGTAAVARDLISVVDALNEDGLLRYYGVSYGSLLGTTAAAMFPERVDKMYLDGIVNAHEYYHSVDIEWISDADKVWSDFFSGCVSAPSACPLARDGKTAQQLEGEFYQWLYQLKHEPFSTGVTSMVTYTSAKSFFYEYIYQPVSWSNVSKIIDAAYQNNATLFVDLVEALPASVAAGLPGQGQYGIRCSDKIVRTNTLDLWLPEAWRLEAQSKIIGDTAVEIQTICAQWKMPAAEIYQGDFKVKTKSPVLFASNEFDPVTPLVSARNMSSGFEGSALLVNKNGHGHSTIQQPSACILQTVAKYFVAGELPSNGTVCEPTAPLFGNVTEAEVIAIANGSGS